MTDEHALTLLQGLPLFAGVNAHTLVQISTRLRRHRYRPGEVLVHQDEPAYSLHVIYRGSVKITRATEEGEQLVLGLVGEGGCIGEVASLDGGLRSATATAVEPTETLSLGREDLVAALRDDSEFALALISTLAGRLRKADLRLEDAYFSDLDMRLARRLLQLAEEFGRKATAGIEVPLPLTQSELASMLGAGRSRVNGLLGVYQDLGVLRLGKGSFTVLQPEALRRRAGR